MIDVASAARPQARPVRGIWVRRWALAMAGVVAGQVWLLDLLGEKLAARVLRALAASPRAADRRLALAQLDRLPEWLDLLLAWLANPSDDDLVLTSLDGDSRLAGPYAQVALGTCLSQEVRRALQADSPADALWSLSLRASRWLRKRPALGRLSLPWLDPQTALAAVPEALREFARRIEAAGQVEGGVARVLETWPGPPEPSTVGLETAPRLPSGVARAPFGAATQPRLDAQSAGGEARKAA